MEEVKPQVSERPACCLFNKFDLNLLGLPGQNEKPA